MKMVYQYGFSTRMLSNILTYLLYPFILCTSIFFKSTLWSNKYNKFLTTMDQKQNNQKIITKTKIVNWYHKVLYNVHVRTSQKCIYAGKCTK